MYYEVLGRQQVLDAAYALYAIMYTRNNVSTTQLLNAVSSYYEGLKQDEKPDKTLEEYMVETGFDGYTIFTKSEFDTKCFRDEAYMESLLAPYPQLLLSWQVNPLTGHSVTQSEIEKAFDAGLIQVGSLNDFDTYQTPYWGLIDNEPDERPVSARIVEAIAEMENDYDSRHNWMGFRAFLFDAGIDG